MKRKQSNEPGEVDQIEALRRAIIAGSEQNWQWHAVPEAERARLRPGILAIAEAATSRLRAEHIARTRSTP